MPGRNKFGFPGLRQRRGRFLVQKEIPAELRHLFKDKRNLERYLRTGDLKLAKQRAPAAMAELNDKIERARGQRLTSLDIEYAARDYREQRIREYFRTSPEPDDDERIQFSLDEFYDAFHYDDWEIVEPVAERVAREHGVKFSDLPVSVREELCRALALADIEALGALRALRQSGIEPKTRPVLNPKAVDPETRRVPERPRSGFAKAQSRGQGQRITEAIEGYIAENTRDPTASISPTTVHQARATTRLFASFTDNAKLDEVTPELATAFIDEMAKLHPNYGRYPGSGEKTLAELVEQYPGPPFVSNRTLNKHATTMRALLKWASVNPNPFAGVSRKKPRVSQTTWLPFTNEELVALFRGLSFQVKPRFHLFPTSLPWLMAIAVFSGMRQGEICELDVEDIKTAGGVDYFDITEAKSEAGVRKVPVHSELDGLGFINYLSNIGSGPLFPGLRPGGAGMKRSHNVAKRFPEYRRRRGVNRDRVVFHSFRKSFVHAILEARIPMNLAAQIVGHEREFTATVYDPEGSPLSQLKEAVEAVRYEGLRLGS